MRKLVASLFAAHIGWAWTYVEKALEPTDATES
jgi:hypothetical protein